MPKLSSLILPADWKSKAAPSPTLEERIAELEKQLANKQFELTETVAQLTVANGKLAHANGLAAKAKAEVESAQFRLKSFESLAAEISQKRFAEKTSKADMAKYLTGLLAKKDLMNEDEFISFINRVYEHPTKVVLQSEDVEKLIAEVMQLNEK